MDKLGALLFSGEWPTLPAMTACTMLGTIGACIGLRAFYDGSYERRKSGSDSADLPLSSPPAIPPSETKSVKADEAVGG